MSAPPAYTSRAPTIIFHPYQPLPQPAQANQTAQGAPEVTQIGVERATATQAQSPKMCQIVCCGPVTIINPTQPEVQVHSLPVQYQYLYRFMQPQSVYHYPVVGSQSPVYYFSGSGCGGPSYAAPLVRTAQGLYAGSMGAWQSGYLPAGVRGGDTVVLLPGR